MTGDVYRSTSRRHSGGQDSYVVLRLNQPNTTTISLNPSGIPNVTTSLTDGRDWASGLAKGEFGPNDFITHYNELAGDNIEDRITGGTVGGDLFVGAGHVDHLKFGVSLTDRRKSRDLITNTLTGGADYYSGDNAINVGALGGNLLSVYSLPNFMSGVKSRFPRSFIAFDVPAYEAALAAYKGTRADGSAYDYSNAAPAWNPLESYRVSEKTASFYVQADLSGDRWDGNVGVRVVSTNTTSQAWTPRSPASPRTGRSTTPRPTPIPPASARRAATPTCCRRPTSSGTSATTCSCAWARPRPWRGPRWSSWRRPAPPRACPGASSPRSTAATST